MDKPAPRPVSRSARHHTASFPQDTVPLNDTLRLYWAYVRLEMIDATRDSAGCLESLPHPGVGWFGWGGGGRGGRP